MTDSSIPTIGTDSYVNQVYPTTKRSSRSAERDLLNTIIKTRRHEFNLKNYGRIEQQITRKVEKQVATVYHDVQVSAPSSLYTPFPAASGCSNDSLVNSFEPQSSAGVLPSLTTGASSLNLRLQNLSHILTLLQR
jgi:hypothetical protein